MEEGGLRIRQQQEVAAVRLSILMLPLYPAHNHIQLVLVAPEARPALLVLQA
jgi:hypothetical protein